MRIISGTARGRKLVSPKGFQTRPTSDRVREAVFSILGDLVADSAVLDLYSGTGAMGLEAISRGARSSVMVEKDAEALRCINDNIRSCAFQSKTHVVSQSAISYLNTGDLERGFGLVFADPPYAGDMGNLTLLAISKRAKSLQRCMFTMEHAHNRPLGPIPDNMEIVDSRKYGNVGITFLVTK